jgi:streptomycin 3"-adenylyltransferase
MRMSQHSWIDAPLNVRAQTERLVVLIRAHVGDDLVGVYLHGSLAMGCFNPERSDVDLLAVSRCGMSLSAKWRVAQVLLRLSGAPSPIEISFLERAALTAWQHPAPYDLHYSETHRRRYEEDLESGAWKDWNRSPEYDAGLAAHVTVARARGMTLWGSPILEILPDVPKADYVASILEDLDWARGRKEVPRETRLLNLCRAWWYFREGQILSKDEGGARVLESAPEPLRAAIRQALSVYRGKAPVESIEYDRMESASTYLERRVEEVARARVGPRAKEE